MKPPSSVATVADPFDLARFVDAQAPVYDQVLAELRAAHKRSHWMWFVFPQLKGLGRSATAIHYGIGSRAEAIAYARHPLLGARLRECATLVLQAPPGRSALQIFGSPDDLKLHSCMTLFAAVAPEVLVFDEVLLRYFGGVADAHSLALLATAD